MNQCDLHGCQYNKDGECNYDDANIKIPYYQACRDNETWSDEEDIE